MPVTVTHATVATGSDAGTGEIRRSHWNANHTVVNAAGLSDANTFTAAQIINATAANVLTITNGVSGGTPSSTHGELLIDSNDANMGIHILGNDTANQKIIFGRASSASAGQFTYVQSTDTLTISTANTARFSIDGSGNTLFNVNVGVGNADTRITRTRAGQIAVAGKNVPYIFAQSGNPVSVGAVTTETTLATVSFAGGELGPNGYIQAILHFSCTNNANVKTGFVRLGGAAGTQYMSTTLTSLAGVVRYVSIFNNNSQSAQKSPSPAGQGVGFGTFSSVGVTSTVNTAAAWDLVISAQKANTGDTLTLEGYQVLVCYGA